MTYIIEIVGPGGSGKSRVVTELENSGIFAVIRVEDGRLFSEKLNAAIEAIRLTTRHRLSPSDMLSLFRKCCSVAAGCRLITRAKAGTIIIDEGPIRTLRDTRCRSYSERAAWWDYGKRTLKRIAELGIPILIVELRLDEGTRRLRYRSRTSNKASCQRTARRYMNRLLDRLTKRGTPSPVPTNRRAVRTFVAKNLSSIITQLRVDVAPTDTPEEVAAQIMALIDETFAHRRSAA